MNVVKKKLYFVVAGYFRFWARFVLERWQPRIVVITGSNGKTTLLHLIEAQLGDEAFYSHKANSAFGIPFNILGLSRETLEKTEWIKLILLAPLKAFRKSPKQSTYIVEADCDRPREGKFLAEFLMPEITLWVSSDTTHSENFDELVLSGDFSTVEEAIAYEFGWFVTYTKELVITKDDELMGAQRKRAKAPVKAIGLSQLSSYKLSKNQTFMTSQKGSQYSLPAILPKAAFVQVGMAHMLCKFLKHDFDARFANYKQPPGRSSVFVASNGATLFDSTYNANYASMAAALETFEAYPARNKWLVIGDMVEQGVNEKREHERLAKLIASYKFKRVILVGPRVKSYTKPKLRRLTDNKLDIVAFDKPKPVLNYLKQESTGKEAIFFKGARWLEGIIKHMLKDPKDEAKLCRREQHYQTIRDKWGVG